MGKKLRIKRKYPGLPIHLAAAIKARNREMWFITAILCFITFIAGFYFCTQTYYEFPLNATVTFEGYYNQPLYGHYSEFMEMFELKEN